MTNVKICTGGPTDFGVINPFGCVALDPVS